MTDVRMGYMELRRVESPLNIQNWSARKLSLFLMFHFAHDAYISTTHLHRPRFSTQVVAQSHLRKPNTSV